MATTACSDFGAWFKEGYNYAHTYLKEGRDQCRKYSLLTQQACVFGLNCVFLACKSLSNVPPKLTKATLVSLDIVGLCAFPTYFDQIKKSSLDTVSSIRTRQLKLTLISLGRVVETFSNIGLTCGSFAAAMAGYTGDEEGQQLAYNNMIIWGEISLALTYTLDLAYIYINRQALREIPLISEEERFSILRSMDDRRKPIDLSCHLRCCMDKDTLRKLLKAVKRLEDEQAELTLLLMDVVRKNVITESRYDDCGQFILNTAGLGCMVIYKYLTPNNLEAAALSTFLSGCWLVVAIVKTSKQIGQRDDIEQSQLSNIQRQIEMTSPPQ
ncbi:MAG: hypothetical protein WC222_04085 [Parachlamydiales bacterium]|jgi:hypothetical protein